MASKSRLVAKEAASLFICAAMGIGISRTFFPKHCPDCTCPESQFYKASTFSEQRAEKTLQSLDHDVLPTPDRHNQGPQNH